MRLKANIVFVFIFLSFFSEIFAQKRAGVWYFGENAGLNFNVDPAVPLTDGALNTEEGCATVCNAQGDLLFYTDGITVYNKNHAQMDKWRWIGWKCFGNTIFNHCTTTWK